MTLCDGSGVFVRERLGAGGPFESFEGACPGCVACTVSHAITVWQPFASFLMMPDVKPCETRPSPPSGPWRNAEGVKRYPGCAIQPGERIAVHAAMRCVTGAIGEFEVEDDTPGRSEKQYLLRGPKGWPYRLPLGVIIGTVRVVDVVPIIPGDTRSRCPMYIRDDPDEGFSLRPHGGLWMLGTQLSEAISVESWRPYGDFTPGRWAWICEEPERLSRPIRCRGSQGVWNLPSEISDQLAEVNG